MRDFDTSVFTLESSGGYISFMLDFVIQAQSYGICEGNIWKNEHESKYIHNFIFSYFHESIRRGYWRIFE